MGIIVGFDDLSGGSFDRRARAQLLMDEAALAGASISRIQADWGGLESTSGAFDSTALAELLDALDIATFNHCYLDSFLQVTGPDRWATDVARMKDAAGELPIMIQELGCPTGYGDDGAGAPTRPANGLMGSPTIQLEYFEYFRNVFTDDPQFRAATVFQLYDWSPALARRFGDLVRAEGATLIGDRFEEWLATVGVCRWADGSCRPAWDAFLETLRVQGDARDTAAE